jgi:hypothetical protein
MEDIYNTSEDIQSSLCRNSYNVPEIDEDELAAELEALGDEIVADNDPSYLDQATQAPGIPPDSTVLRARVPERIPPTADTVSPKFTKLI